MAEHDTARDDRIEAVEFKPTAAAGRDRSNWFTPRRIVVVAGVAGVAWILWFIFTAKSVRFEVQPPPDSLSVDDALAFQLGDTHLLRQGTYRVRATLAGYHPIDHRIDVGVERNQTFPLAMTKLPGTVRFDVDPVGASVDIEAIEVPREAPFEASIPAGSHVAIIRHERYQEATVAFDVEGMERQQTVTAALAPNWADVLIPTRPPGAEVLIDRASSGFTTPGPVPILAGEHRLSVKLPGYQTWTDILYVEAGQDRTLPAVELVVADGLVEVASDPRGASITVNGTYRGVTPLEVDVAPDRSHEFRVFKVGFDSQTRVVNVPSGEQRSIAFSLNALRGDIAVEALPDDAGLWIDGKHHGPARGTVTLTAVPHEVEIRKEGYAGFRKTVTPQPGFTQALRVKLLTLEEARMAALKQVRSTSQGHELVLLNPGRIRMGASRREPGRRANEVLRTVELTRLFYLGRHEVTNGQFRIFAAGHSSGDYQNIDLNGDRQPATGMSWQEAALYCNWLSRQDRLEPFYTAEFGKVVGFNPDALGYRMPTEAEWAWTARSVDNEDEPLRFAWGDRLPPPERHGNYADQAASHIVARIVLGFNDNYNVSAPIGTFPANAKGIHDLGGNVAEWVNDYYEIPTAGETLNPLGPAEGDYHVIRGASWQKGTVSDIRLSFRDYGTEGRQDLGFRIARFAE